MEEFKAGDVVHFKSGSPDMTVWKVEGDYVYVQWHQDGRYLNEAFLKVIMTKRTYTV